MRRSTLKSRAAPSVMHPNVCVEQLVARLASSTASTFNRMCGVISIHCQLQFRPLSFIIKLPARIYWRAFFISPSSFVTSPYTLYAMEGATSHVDHRIACIYQRIVCTTNTAPSGWVHGLYTHHIFLMYTYVFVYILCLHMYMYCCIYMYICLFFFLRVYL